MTTTLKIIPYHNSQPIICTHGRIINYHMTIKKMFKGKFSWPAISNTIYNNLQQFFLGQQYLIRYNCCLAFILLLCSVYNIIGYVVSQCHFKSVVILTQTECVKMITPLKVTTYHHSQPIICTHGRIISCHVTIIKNAQG